MTVNKSTRHSRIAGEFGEALVLYWLSKHGYECANVDHTGIDLLARDPVSGELMGISVKARTRNMGRETSVLNFPKGEIEKVRTACTAFGCQPWFAFVVDAADIIRMFMMPLHRLLELRPPGKKVISLNMKPSWVEQYRRVPGVRWVELETGCSSG